MNKFLLWLILLPRGLWRSMGADIDQLSAILKVKLLLDDRRPLAFGRQQQKKKGKSSVFIGLFLSFFTGIVYTLPLFALEHDRIFSLWVSFTLFLFLLTFMLITDFSNVLIDTRDKYIVLPRPVSDRTLLLSRILHIFTYLFRIVVPMSLPGWAAMYFLEGWKGVLWYPAPLFLLVFTALFFVIGLYMLLLHLFSASRFKEILSGFQIVFSVVLFAFYLAPRMLGTDAMHTLDTSRFTWARWFPSYWLAATWTWG